MSPYLFLLYACARVLSSKASHKNSLEPSFSYAHELLFLTGNSCRITVYQQTCCFCVIILFILTHYDISHKQMIMSTCPRRYRRIQSPPLLARCTMKNYRRIKMHTASPENENEIILKNALGIIRDHGLLTKS